MHLFVYEWVTGGGLVGHPGALPESLLREGQAMAQAVAADAAQIDGCQVTLLRDLRIPSLVAPGARIVEVDSRSAHDTEFDRLATEADGVLLIAPETDHALLRIAERAEDVGAKLLSPSPEFIALAGDKQRTGKVLQGAGLPMPRSCRLEPEEALPKDFAYPGVLKPVVGAGSEATHVVAGPQEHPPAHAWPRRLERFLPGTPASVALLCGPGGKHLALPPCRQRLSGDGSLSYLGGETPLTEGLAKRAVGLAERALAAMPPVVGYIGVDLILGSAPDGSEDGLIEVNPRLTTSYTGLRHAARGNLLHAMVQAAQGEEIDLRFDPRRLAFDADGAVYYTA